MEPADPGDARRRRNLQPAPHHDGDHSGDLRRRVRRDVLFDLRSPQVRRPPGREFPREHHRRDHLGHHPVPDPDRRSLAGDQVDPESQGHRQPRHHHQGNGLSVEMGLRLLEGRRRGHIVPFESLHSAGPDHGERSQGRALSPRSGQPHGRARGQEGARAPHLQRRHSRLDGPGVRREAGRDSRLRAR